MIIPSTTSRGFSRVFIRPVQRYNGSWLDWYSTLVSSGTVLRLHRTARASQSAAIFADAHDHCHTAICYTTMQLSIIMSPSGFYVLKRCWSALSTDLDPANGLPPSALSCSSTRRETQRASGGGRLVEVEARGRSYCQLVSLEVWSNGY